MSQVEFAYAVGKSQEWASNIETGRIKSPPVETLTAMATVLRMSVDVLVIAARYASTKDGAARVIAEASAAYDADNPMPHEIAEPLGRVKWTPEAVEILKPQLQIIVRLQEQRGPTSCDDEPARSVQSHPTGAGTTHEDS